MKAAARRWAGGRGGEPAASDDPLTAAAQLPRRPEAEPVELAPDEWEAVSLFFALDTQWRRAGLAGERAGLDYAAVEPTARMLGIDVKPRLLHDLRAMEDAALAAFAERARRRG